MADEEKIGNVDNPTLEQIAAQDKNDPEDVAQVVNYGSKEA